VVVPDVSGVLNRETYRQDPYKTLSFMAAATPPVGIWERGQGHDGPTERPRAYARFRAWLELGHERNLASFAAAQGISRQALYETARRYNWRERALAWDRAEAAAGRCPPPPLPKAREPIRSQNPPEAPTSTPPDAPPDPLGSMGREAARDHRLQEVDDYIQAMRKIGRSFVRESEQSLELLHLMQDTFRLEIERYRQLMQENKYQAAADISKAANSTAFMIVRFSSTATSLAAAGRQHWGDAAGLLQVLRKVYGA
jgi:hypothetical protein